MGEREEVLLLKNRTTQGKISLHLPCSAGQGPLPEAPNSAHPGRFALTAPAGNMGRIPDCQGCGLICSVLQTDLVV